MNTSFDFGKINRKPQCRVCQLLDIHPDAYKQLHIMCFHGGRSIKEVAAWLGETVSEFNKENTEKPLPMIQYMQVYHHMREHVPQDIVSAARINKSLADTIEAPNRARERLAELATEGDRQSIQDFGRLSGVVERLAKRFEDFDKTFDETGVTTADAVTYKQFAVAAANCLERLISVRNQDKLVRAALTSAFDVFAQGALSQIFQVLDSAFFDFRSAFKDPTDADRLARLLREQCTGLMLSNARVALDTVRGQLKVS